MQGTLTTKVSTELRGEFIALAHAQEFSQSALFRMTVNRYVKGDDMIHTMINALGEDLSRILALSRFLAEKVDCKTTNQLLRETDFYLSNAKPLGEESFRKETWHE